jgi:hypothetical protein
MKAKCPKDSEHKSFETIVHVTEFWEVDEEGNFLDQTDSGEVTHGPNRDNIWTCMTCQAEAVVED